MTDIQTQSGSATQRLQALGLDLPAVGRASKYENHQAIDSSVYVAGQLPTRTVNYWARASWVRMSISTPPGGWPVRPH
jgi:hypothetical protein